MAGDHAVTALLQINMKKIAQIIFLSLIVLFTASAIGREYSLNFQVGNRITFYSNGQWLQVADSDYPRVLALIKTAAATVTSTNEFHRVLIDSASKNVQVFGAFGMRQALVTNLPSYELISSNVVVMSP